MFFSRQPDSAGNYLNRVIIENVTVENVNKEAIAVWDCQEVRITGCHVKNCNFDAYNPNRINKLLVANNWADDVLYGMECNMLDNTESGLKSEAIYANNILTKVWSYGIKIYSGDSVKIIGNIFKDRDLESDSDNRVINNEPIGTQDIGIFISPEAISPGGIANKIGTLEIIGNTIDGFWDGGISNAAPKTAAIGTSDGNQVVDRVLIKDNTFINQPHNCIQLTCHVADEIPKLIWPDVQITSNSFFNWNLRNIGSTEESAIFLNYVTGGSITNNTFEHFLDSVTNNRDSLRVDNVSDMIYANNIVRGCVSVNMGEGYSVIRSHGPNTRFVAYNNFGIGGSGAGPEVLTTTGINAIATPIAPGRLIFDSTLSVLKFWNGTSWVS